MRIFTSDNLALEAILDEPPGEPVGGVVLCHPHPQMGGSMRAPLLQVVATKLCEAGISVLRFNTRGTGASEGSFGGGVAESADLTAALAAMTEAPKGLAGWSFGARLAMRHTAVDPLPLVVFAPVLREGQGLPPLEKPTGPTLPVVGDRDQFVGVAAVEEYFETAPVVLHGCDHFFIGRFAEQAAQAAVDFLTERLPLR